MLRAERGKKKENLNHLNLITTTTSLAVYTLLKSCHMPRQLALGAEHTQSDPQQTVGGYTIPTHQAELAAGPGGSLAVNTFLGAG